MRDEIHRGKKSVFISIWKTFHFYVFAYFLQAILSLWCDAMTFILVIFSLSFMWCCVKRRHVFIREFLVCPYKWWLRYAMPCFSFIFGSWYFSLCFHIYIFIYCSSSPSIIFIGFRNLVLQHSYLVHILHDHNDFLIKYLRCLVVLNTESFNILFAFWIAYQELWGDIKNEIIIIESHHNHQRSS